MTGTIRGPFQSSDVEIFHNTIIVSEFRFSDVSEISVVWCSDVPSIHPIGRSKGIGTRGSRVLCLITYDIRRDLYVVLPLLIFFYNIRLDDRAFRHLLAYQLLFGRIIWMMSTSSSKVAH